MCKNSRTAVRVKGKRLELFNVNVGVHQGLILISFLFAFVLDDIIKDVRGGLLKEILDADAWCFSRTVGRRWKKGI